MDRGSSFGRAARRLRDHDVVLYDRRGYARSHGLRPSPVLGVQIADLLEASARRRSVLIGHSVGGVIALAVAYTHPSLVAAVGCYEPPLRWKEWWPRPRPSRDYAPEEVAESFMRRVAGEELWLALPQATREQRRREGHALLADLDAVDSEPFDPSKLDTPVLVGVGAETEQHFRRGAEELVAELPNAGLRVLSGADHGAHMGDPDGFADFVGEVVDLTRR